MSKATASDSSPAETSSSSSAGGVARRIPITVPTLPLRTGDTDTESKMPQIGLGMWLLDHGAEGEAVIQAAMEIGYRHFDTAYSYGNEATLGKVLKRWMEHGCLKRNDFFVTTKLPMIANRRQSVGPYLEKSLKNLGLDYVDLYLVHSPVGLQDLGDDNLHPRSSDSDDLLWDLDTDLLGVWKGMEEQVDKGLTKAIGVSNFNSEQLGRILSSARIPPANNQVELHVYFQQRGLVKYCQENAVTVTAYAPLGSPGRVEAWGKMGHPDPAKFVPPLMENERVKQLARKHHKNPAQILLRFLTQKGFAVVPKSSDKERLRENLEIFDFTIGEDDMECLEELDQGPAGRSFRFLDICPGIEKHPEYPFIEQLVDTRHEFRDEPPTELLKKKADEQRTKRPGDDTGDVIVGQQQQHEERTL